MPDIDSNITFENGQMEKCVLKIAGGKTFTVTLGNRGYEVVEGGTAPCSTPASTPGSTLGSTPGSTPGPANPTPTANPGPAIPSAPPQQKNEYNTQEDLIKTLGSYGYTSQ